MKTKTKRWAENIRKIRRKSKITQKEMADRLGIHWNSYARIERGEIDIGFNRIEQIEDILGVKILKYIDDNDKESDDIKKVRMNRLVKLTERLQKAVEALTNFLQEEKKGGK